MWWLMTMECIWGVAVAPSVFCLAWLLCCYPAKEAFICLCRLLRLQYHCLGCFCLVAVAVNPFPFNAAVWQVLPFLLRRLKEEVLHDLPPKIIQDTYCNLSPLQVRAAWVRVTWARVRWIWLGTPVTRTLL